MAVMMSRAESKTVHLFNSPFLYLILFAFNRSHCMHFETVNYTD